MMAAEALALRFIRNGIGIVHAVAICAMDRVVIVRRRQIVGVHGSSLRIGYRNSRRCSNKLVSGFEMARQAQVVGNIGLLEPFGHLVGSRLAFMHLGKPRRVDMAAAACLPGVKACHARSIFVRLLLGYMADRAIGICRPLDRYRSVLVGGPFFGALVRRGPWAATGKHRDEQHACSKEGQCHAYWFLTCGNHRFAPFPFAIALQGRPVCVGSACSREGEATTGGTERQRQDGFAEGEYPI